MTRRERGLVLECDRVAPSYVRVRLFQDGKPKIYRNVGDASCCGAENYFDYGTSWKKGPFSCASTQVAACAATTATMASR